MEKIEAGPIRKLIVGIDPKEAIAFQVDQKRRIPEIGEVQITDIIRDETNFYYYGMLRYIVYAKRTSGEGGKFVLKYFEGVPVSVEPFIPEPTKTVIGQ